jgi:hypothetical protein
MNQRSSVLFLIGLLLGFGTLLFLTSVVVRDMESNSILIVQEIQEKNNRLVFLTNKYIESDDELRKKVILDRIEEIVLTMECDQIEYEVKFSLDVEMQQQILPCTYGE